MARNYSGTTGTGTSPEGRDSGDNYKYFPEPYPKTVIISRNHQSREPTNFQSAEPVYNSPDAIQNAKKSNAGVIFGEMVKRSKAATEKPMNAVSLIILTGAICLILALLLGGTAKLNVKSDRIQLDFEVSRQP